MLLARYLARGGVGSRKQVLQMVEAGRVRVDDVTVKDPEFLVSGHSVTLDSGAKVVLDSCRIFAYHKPVKEVVSKAPKGDQVSVFQTITARYPDLPLLHAVGRLDYMSEGLLLFTNAGEVSRCLEHPFNAFERQYHVELAREYRALPSLLSALNKPMMVDGTEYRSVSATALDRNWVHVRLTEGKNREIRVLFAKLGLEISRLKRVAYGPFTLDDLQPNQLEQRVIPDEVFDQMAVFTEWNDNGRPQ